MKLIICVSEGTVDAVCTDTAELIDLEICDADNVDTDEDAQHYAAQQYLIDHGGLRDVLNDVYPADQALSSEPQTQPNPNSFVLVASENWSPIPQAAMLQKLHACFADGYLAANAELVRFISSLYRLKSPHAADIYEALRPLLDRQDHEYYALCKQLNDPGYFEEAVQGE